MRNLIKRVIMTLGWSCLILPVLAQGQSNVEVAGLGFFKNIEFDKRLAFLSGVDESEVKELNLVEIEDYAYILLQLLRKEGYDSPVVEGTIQFSDGQEQSITWSIPFTSQVDGRESERLPEFILFDCNPGRLNYYESVEVSGVRAIDPSIIQDFFIPSGVLFTRRQELAFTEGNLDSRLGRLLSALRSEGHAQARVVEKQVQIDEASGAVSIQIEIDEGPVHLVGEASIVVLVRDEEMPDPQPFARQGAILNTLLIREQRQAILNEFFHAGYPDCTLRVEYQPQPPGEDGTVTVDFVYHVTPGRRVRLEGVVFKPEGLLQRTILERQPGI